MPYYSLCLTLSHSHLFFFLYVFIDVFQFVLHFFIDFFLYFFPVSPPLSHFPFSFLSPSVFSRPGSCLCMTPLFDSNDAGSECRMLATSQCQVLEVIQENLTFFLPLHECPLCVSLHPMPLYSCLM